MKLCQNCLNKGAVIEFPIGYEKGPQMDPWRATVSLCALCTKALEEGDFATLHERYSEMRQVTR